MGKNMFSVQSVIDEIILYTLRSLTDLYMAVHGTILNKVATALNHPSLFGTVIETFSGYQLTSSKAESGQPPRLG